MHAVLITFHSSAAPATLTGLFARYAEALQAVPGLVMKIWLDDGEMLGGFYLFATRQAAEEFLASDLVGELEAHPAFTARAARHFAVMDELSRATGTPQPLGV
ncbi:MAG: YdhR family protein [Chloroflexota bacterium]|nr:YdhR family protein [Chloroflexota bacterium]